MSPDRVPRRLRQAGRAAGVDVAENVLVPDALPELGEASADPLE